MWYFHLKIQPLKSTHNHFSINYNRNNLQRNWYLKNFSFHSFNSKFSQSPSVLLCSMSLSPQTHTLITQGSKLIGNAITLTMSEFFTSNGEWPLLYQLWDLHCDRHCWLCHSSYPIALPIFRVNKTQVLLTLAMYLIKYAFAQWWLQPEITIWHHRAFEIS